MFWLREREHKTHEQVNPLARVSIEKKESYFTTERN